MVYLITSVILRVDKLPSNPSNHPSNYKPSFQPQPEMCTTYHDEIGNTSTSNLREDAEVVEVELHHI